MFSMTVFRYNVQKSIQINDERNQSKLAKYLRIQILANVKTKKFEIIDIEKLQKQFY